MPRTRDITRILLPVIVNRSSTRHAGHISASAVRADPSQPEAVPARPQPHRVHLRGAGPARCGSVPSCGLRAYIGGSAGPCGWVYTEHGTGSKMEIDSIPNR